MDERVFTAPRFRAVIFDFNGVVADDETPHLLCFQQALAEHGLSLTKDEYYGAYLGMDERACAAALLAIRHGSSDPALLHAILQRKARLFRECTAQHKPQFFPGVIEFVKQAGRCACLAIASGGRREQIDYALSGTPIERDFAVIVSADDIAIGKPDPAIYEFTLKLINGAMPRPPLITAAQCLVIEDSRAGVRSARAAGMRVVALATTYPADQLAEADLVLSTLEGVTVTQIQESLSSTPTRDPDLAGDP